MRRLTLLGRFLRLRKRIEPTEDEVKIYRGHEQTVRRRLETSFNTNRVVRIGSYARGTSIRYTSDVDLMLILKRSEARWGGTLMSSTTVQGRVKRELDARYWQTDVGRDRQAIVVRFRDNRYPVDIVPAVYIEHESITGFADGRPRKYPIFLIPDGDGGWLRTSPQAHNTYINEADAWSGGRLKKTARLLKYWRRCRTPHIPLNSFYAELLLAKENVCHPKASLQVCFNNALAKLAEVRCEPLEDPLGISGEIKAAYTDPMRKTAYEAAHSSAGRTYKAIMAARSGREDEAIRLWELVFNHQF